MKKVLHIIANPKDLNDSLSKRLAEYFFAQYAELHPKHVIETLDLAEEKVPFLTGNLISSLFKFEEVELSDEEKLAVELSDRYIAQLKNAQKIVITAPMWNFTIPAKLKAYFDLIIRPKKTYEVTDHGPKGLLGKKPIMFLGARGGVYPAGTPLAHFDFHGPFLSALFVYLGSDDIESVWAEGSNHPHTGGPEAVLAKAKAEIDARVGRF